jgi:hypothetical protein
MRPLERSRLNYLYEDWPEVEASAGLATAVLEMPYRGRDEEAARLRWASLLQQAALFKRTRWINWRVTPEAPVLPPDLLAQLRDLGDLIDRLLLGVDRGVGSTPFLRRALGFPACPEEEALWRLQRGDPLRFFRLDLALDRNSCPRLLEIQVVAGGLGLTQALRTAYGPHPELPGIADLYEEAVSSETRTGGRAAPKDFADPGLIAVLGAARSAYRHEHLVLSRHLQGVEMAVAPLAALRFDASGRPTLSDGRHPGIIHRLFRSPSLFRRSPEWARSLADSIRSRRARVVNPWKDWLEDKRVLALVHDAEATADLSEAFSPGERDRLRTFVPLTRIADHQEVSRLLGLRRSQRGYYLKKGRSFEGRHVWDAQQVSLRQWEAACLRARREGDWIVQETVRGTPWPFQYLDLQRQEMRSMQGHLRLSPFYFRDESGSMRLGDLLITAREEASRIHGASDAILVVPGPPS